MNKVKLYGGAYYAFHDIYGTAIGAFTVTAKTEEEAIGVGTKNSRGKWTSEKGWRHHSAVVAEVTPEQIGKLDF